MCCSAFPERATPRSPQTPTPTSALSGCRKDGNSYHYYQPIRATSRMLLTVAIARWAIAHDARLDSRRILGAVAPVRAEGRTDGRRQADLPTEPTRKSIDLKRCILVATAIITVFLAMVAAYVIVRYVIVKPLRHCAT